MNDVTLIVVFIAIAVLILMTFALIYLWRQQNRLKHDVHALTKKLQSSIEDVAGLCSAAVSVDRRLMANESRLNGVLENLSAPQTEIVEDDVIEDDQPQGYELAIEKIRGGANVDDLVKTCGLTRDEAVLLVRLHGR